MQNQHTRSQLQSALAVADPARPPDSGEFEKLKAEWGREQQALEQEHSQRRAELIGLRGQLHTVQQKLDAESRGRRLDASKASQQINSLESQLEVALRAAANLSADDLARRNLWLRWSGVCAAAAVVCAAALVYTQTLSRAPASVSNATAPVADVPSVGSAPPASATKDSSPVSRPGGSPQAFSRSLFRLGEALSALPEEPENILRAIRSKDSKVCSFQWNKGQPALIYSAGSPGMSISSSLERCAEAVEKYRSP